MGIYMKFEKLNKKALYCMYAVTSITCIIISGIAWGTFFAFEKGIIDIGQTAKHWVQIICIVVFVLELLETLISPFFRYHRYRYSLTDEEVQVKQGYIYLEHTIVPISRLHKINIEAGPIDRMFGLASVEITTAGGNITIKFLERKKAEQIAEILKKRINVIVEEESKHEE